MADHEIRRGGAGFTQHIFDRWIKERNPGERFIDYCRWIKEGGDRVHERTNPRPPSASTEPPPVPPGPKFREPSPKARALMDREKKRSDIHD